MTETQKNKLIPVLYSLSVRGFFTELSRKDAALILRDSRKSNRYNRDYRDVHCRKIHQYLIGSLTLQLRQP